MPLLMRKETIMISQYGNTYYGLSTDDKPSGTALNGRAFVEMDTGTLYFFDAEGGAWLTWGEENSGGDNPK